MKVAIDREAVEDFLDLEVGLLDAGDIRGWVDLCTEDAIYWMPVSPEQQDPLGEISILYENRTLMELRKFNFGHPLAPSFETTLRCSHVLGRARFLARHDTDHPTDVHVQAKFHCAMWYRDDQRLFAGTARYQLALDGDGFKIRLKRVDLVNAEAWHRSIPIYL